MCANALAAAGGIEVRIIDQRPSKISVGHTDWLHPRTIEVLQVSSSGVSLNSRISKEPLELEPVRKPEIFGSQKYCESLTFFLCICLVYPMA
ncbi:hypothetical protein BKA83DRAFT_4178146 [Pisolithus microcarpus]|nr:hypothetical protein BKA83DRAFT_4178146 [Pisolithus microcarpus]